MTEAKRILSSVGDRGKKNSLEMDGQSSGPQKRGKGKEFSGSLSVYKEFRLGARSGYGSALVVAPHDGSVRVHNKLSSRFPRIVPSLALSLIFKLLYLEM